MIILCERLAGQDANVTTVPVSVLKFARQLTRVFEWTNDVADRLAFSEVIYTFISVLLLLVIRPVKWAPVSCVGMGQPVCVRHP